MDNTDHHHHHHKAYDIENYQSAQFNFYNQSLRIKSIYSLSFSFDLTICVQSANLVKMSQRYLEFHKNTVRIGP